MRRPRAGRALIGRTCLSICKRELDRAGGISKQDLRRFLRWGAEHLGYPSLADVVAAAPTAELEPIRPGVAAQTDEQDMGMTYEVRQGL